MREVLNSIVNIFTYMALGIILLVYGISMYKKASPYEMLIFFGVFLGLLLLAVVIGYTGNRAFPNFEMERYRYFFFAIESIAVLLVLFLGIALRIESASTYSIVMDNWGMYDMSTLLYKLPGFVLPDAIKNSYIDNPVIFGYAMIAALAVYIGGESLNTILVMQIILHVLLGLAVYRVSRKVSGRLAGIISLGVIMIMPSLVSATGFLYEYLPGLSVLLIQLWVFYSLQKRKHANLSNGLKVLFYSIDGILMALAVFLMPENIVVLIGELIYALTFKKNVKLHIISAITLTTSSLISFVILLFVKAHYLLRPVASIANGYIYYLLTGGTSGITGDLKFMSINLNLEFASDSYSSEYLLHNLPMENEIIYGNLLLMCVVCLVFLWIQSERAYFVLNLYFLTIFSYGAVFYHDNIYHLLAMPYVAILVGVLFEKIYVSFKLEPKRISKMVKKLSGININKDLSEGVIDLNDESKLEDSLIAPIDNKTEEKTEEKIETKTEDKKTTLEKLTEVIEEELPTVESVTGSKPEDKEESDKFKPLHNPLPLPKSKSSSKKEDDFDIEVSESDDFDI